MLNGMSEQEFYDMYPTQEAWESAQQMKLGGLSGAPNNGQPTADQFFSYGSHYNDSINVPMGNPYYAAEGGTPYYGGPIRPYDGGGDYNSPTNYGSFPAMQTGGVNPEMAAFLQQRNPGNVKNIPSDARNYDAKGRDLSYLYPNNRLGLESQKFDTDSIVPIPNNPQFNAAYKSGKFVITGNTPQAGNQAAKINAGHLKQGKDKTVYADYSDLYKEDGGILDASNNQSYPMFNDGGRYNLLNLIKSASKKMKKAYGGDTVTQGGNSDNYGQGVTNAFINGIKSNTMNALMNEEEQNFSSAIKQMGGYAGGYDNSYSQGPQLNPQNSAMQSMYQQRTDDLQSNVDQSGQNFMNASSNLVNSFRPQTKVTVKAGVGMQTESTEPSRNMSPEEWAWMDEQRKANENKVQYNKYFKSNTQGMNYIPMNYGYKTKISKNADAKLQALAANPTSTLKKYVDKDTLFGHKTKLVFGSKDLYEDNMKIKSAPDAINHHNNNKLSDFLNKIESKIGSKNKSKDLTQQNSVSGVSPLRPGVGNANPALDNVYTPERQTLNLPNSPRMQGPTQGVETRAEANQGQAPFYAPTHSPFPLKTANAPGYGYGGGLMMAQDGTSLDDNMPIKMQPIDTTAGFSNYVDNQGLNLQQQQGHLKDPETGSMYTGKEKKTTITQKTGLRPSGEAAANWGLAGVNALSSRLEQNQDRSSEQLADSQIAGRAFLAKPANAMNQGDYNINSGDFRENQKVPVQFPGNTSPAYGTSFAEHGGYMQEGGMADGQPDPQQIMQGVATMLQQGAQPQQVAKQLVEMGIPQEQVMQLIQAVMQQLQGSQEEAQPMRYGGFAEGGQAEEESYEDDLSDAEIADLRAQGYDVEYI